MRRVLPTVAFSLLVLLLGAAASGAETRLLRFPDVHGEQVVFTYAGDLWLASTTGGTARRLTTHPGVELFGKFSPDGEWIAFTGQYDGDEQVYVVPTAGGAPKQLTFYPAQGPLAPRWGYDNQVYGWSPDGEQVLFRSMRDGWDLGDTQLFLVPVDGGLPEALPMPESGGGSLSPDGGKVAYSPVTRDFRHWKRYEGGWAQDLYIFDLSSYDLQQITDHPRTDRDPMWIGDRIYFASDRDGILNLYVYDIAAQTTEQLTSEEVWDVRWPSADPATGTIVYELNGELQLFDAASGRVTPISITVPTDALERRPRREEVAGLIQGIGLSPQAERALFVARGDLFSAPIEHGLTRNLTRSSDAHDREASWSPDGRWIAFVSDASGEEELYVIDHEGRESARQLTRGSTGRYYSPAWSPDSKYLAVRNQKGQLFVVDAEGGAVTMVADDKTPFGLTYEWAPGGGWLALSLADETGFRSIHLWRQSDATLHRVTGEMWNEFSPSFDPKGNYLFFLADRMFQPQISAFEFDYAVDRESWIYAVALRDDVAHPFPPRSDEVTVEGENGDGEEKGENGDGNGDDGEENGDEEEGDEDSVDGPLEIDLDGLSERVVRVPTEADNYGGVVALDGQLLIVRTGAFYYGRSPDRQPAFQLFDLEKRELKDLATFGGRATVSQDRKKILLQNGGSYQLFELSAGAEGKPVSTAGLTMEVDPEQEWRQIFDEVWRRFRDFFYVENMHGYDWVGLQERYEPLLRHVAHRSDLNYVLSEMIAELNVSHAYVTGGDFEIPERPKAALLGARFEVDGERYRIARIFRGQNEEPTYRSPLTEVGVGVAEGDWLFAINGVELSSDDNPFRLLRHAGGAPVELLVGSSPDEAKARRVLVDPISDENSLIYLAWTEEKRRRVEEASAGRLGYIHIPDMGADGIREWIKWYYGQIRKQGLVIDVRNNGGGNVSQMIIPRLATKPLMVDFERNNELDDPYPGAVFYGHLACLADEDTASDGDQFAHVFREAGLGPVIGKRTWGGVVGIYGRGPLIDGGGLSVPEAGSASLEGEWVIEGLGVEPDIEVSNHPRDLIQGRDAQLETAIQVLMEAIETEPRRLPERPAPPVKTE